MAKQNEELLRARALERIVQHRLPHVKPTRVWGGYGSGLPCSLCDQPILATEPEMELEYESSERVPTVRFHLRCQVLWDSACQQKASQWIPVRDALPPLHTVVEARVSFGTAGGGVVLNVIRVCDGRTGPIIWINATTNVRLPEGWQPTEWRALPEASPPALASADTAPIVQRRA
ncbi:MAG: hypothetical protein IRZ28_17715 [Steroidobacteraceae bacterium]|nr:hypothetical protein [Steroidobacteraceae bacterium]